MDGLLVVIFSLFGSLLFLGWSCARSYYESGKLRGMEDAVAELGRGIRSHYELDGQVVPEAVQKALAALKIECQIRSKPRRRGTDPIHAQLWVLGDAIGEACWLKGHAAGIRRKAPAEGRIRVDLSLVDMLQLSHLADLGFRNMMPNHRAFEFHRFSGEDDAKEAAAAIGRLEGTLPTKNRPNLLAKADKRQRLIRDWWKSEPPRLTA